MRLLNEMYFFPIVTALADLIVSVSDKLSDIAKFNDFKYNQTRQYH
jgi:hypothetical protein